MDEGRTEEADHDPKSPQDGSNGTQKDTCGDDFTVLFTSGEGSRHRFSLVYTPLKVKDVKSESNNK